MHNEPTCNDPHDGGISLVSVLSCSRRFEILLSVAFHIQRQRQRQVDDSVYYTNEIYRQIDTKLVVAAM